MMKEVKEELAIRRKLLILELARESGNAAKICREFEAPRSTFYKWKKAFDAEGRAGLARKKPIARSHPWFLIHFGINAYLRTLLEPFHDVGNGQERISSR
jgi:transposase-like protein